MAWRHPLEGYARAPQAEDRAPDMSSFDHLPFCLGEMRYRQREPGLAIPSGVLPLLLFMLA